MDSVQQQIINDGYSNLLYDLEKIAQIELQKCLSIEEAFMTQKSSLNWFTKSDKNTAYFHRMPKIRQATNRMSILKKDNAVLCTQSEIESHVIDFYTKSYASDNSCIDNGIVDIVITPLASMEDNLTLTNLSSLEEVKDAVFSMNGSGSPWPYVFGGGFFQTY